MRVYTAQGGVIEDRRRLLTVLKHTLGYYSLDLTALREKYGRLLGLRHSVPLPLSPHLVLVPLKTRLPRFEADGATGYVNACAVRDVTPADPGGIEQGLRCLVHLEGGHTLPCCFSAAKTRERIRTGHNALLHYKSLLYPETGEKALAVHESALSEALNRVKGGSGFLYAVIIDPKKL